jgi:DNA-binding IclR family transcriptional regulator
VDDEEETIGSRCIGAPITNQMGRVIAAVSVAGYKQQIHRETFQILIGDVKNAAFEISTQIIQANESEDSSY